MDIALRTWGVITGVCRPFSVARTLKESGQLMAMSIPALEDPTSSRDPRTHNILAKSIYKELRANGYDEQAVMAIAGELLGMVADEVKRKRSG
jgi:hypothetical protein